MGGRADRRAAGGREGLARTLQREHAELRRGPRQAEREHLQQIERLSVALESSKQAGRIGALLQKDGGGERQASPTERQTRECTAPFTRWFQTTSGRSLDTAMLGLDCKMPCRVRIYTRILRRANGG